MILSGSSLRFIFSHNDTNPYFLQAQNISFGNHLKRFQGTLFSSFECNLAVKHTDFLNYYLTCLDCIDKFCFLFSCPFKKYDSPCANTTFFRTTRVISKLEFCIYGQGDLVEECLKHQGHS